MARIVFFDGFCNMCNRFVDFLLRNDFEGKFAPLQGQTAKKVLGKDAKTYGSVVYVDGNKRYEGSTAVIRIISQLKGWSAVKAFFLVPKPVRDWLYNFVSEHRYEWFGRRKTCRVPSKEEKRKFLP